jgi:hypothetical protein
VQARLEGMSWKIPKEVLVGMNDRDKKWHDLYRVDVKTGTRTLVQKNEGFGEIHADHDFKVRFLMRPEKDGSQSYLDAKQKEIFKVPHEDTLTTHVFGFDKNGTKAFLVDSRERNTAALVEMDLATNQTKTLLDDGQASAISA